MCPGCEELPDCAAQVSQQQAAGTRTLREVVTHGMRVVAVLHWGEKPSVCGGDGLIISVKT